MALRCRFTAGAFEIEATTILRFAASRARRCLIGLLALAILVAAPAFPQSEGGPGYGQDELDQLLAPVALYPDQLLSQILMAATYPLEVVQAARFVQQNPDLQGDALDQALAEKSWDPSVQSLAAYPQVLAMMNENLEWTQRLGDAFLVDQARVMDTVQALREKAIAAGNLQSTPQLSVTTQGDEIVIDTAQPDALYVPVYNPLTTYGSWWAPAYPPWFWCPPPVFGYPYCPVYNFGIVFGTPCPIRPHHWDWAYPRWRVHRIVIDARNNRFWHRPGRAAPPPDEPWQHSPDHRRGVAYPTAATRDRFVKADPNAVRSRQDFRGYERIPSAPPPNAMPQAPSANRPPNAVPQAPIRGAPAPAVVRPAPMPRQITPFDPALSRQQTEINAQRGLQSRQSIPSAPAPIGQPPASRAPVGQPQVGHLPMARPPVSNAPAGRPPAPAPVPQGGGVRR
jgi:hypothetical protein